MSSITVNTPALSFVDYRTLNWAFLRKTRKSLFIAPLFGFVFVGFNSLFPGYSKEGSLDTLSVVSLLVIAVFIGGFIVFNLNRNIKRNYLNTPMLADGMSVTLSETTIMLRSATSYSEHPWPASFKKATRLKQWILLASGPASAYFLDTNHIQAPATLADLQALLQRHGITLTS